MTPAMTSGMLATEMWRSLRKRIVACVVAALVAVIPLVGVPEARAAEGDLTVGLFFEPESLNPLNEGFASMAIIGEALFPGAVDLNTPSREPVADVLVELPTVANGGVTENSDGTATVSYRIKDEAVWEDGTPISGADFEFTLGLLCSETTTPSIPQQAACPDTFEEPDIFILEDTVVAGPKTFEFTLNRQSLDYVSLFPIVVPKHHVEGSDFASDWDDRPWLSGGPFRFVEWVKGDRLVVERNPAYWKTDPETGAPLPATERVVFRFFDDESAMLEAFRAKEVDVVSFVRTPLEEAIALRSDGAEVPVLDRGGGGTILFLNYRSERFDRNPGSLNEFLDFRRALAHAIDRDVIAEHLFSPEVSGLESVLLGSPNTSRDPWSSYPHDPTEAERLLDSLEQEAGRDFSIDPPTLDLLSPPSSYDPNRASVALEVVPDLLDDVGIDTRVETMDFGEIIDLLFDPEGAWDTALLGLGGGSGVRGAAGMLEFFKPGSSSNVGHWGEAEADVGGSHAEDFSEIVDELNTADLTGATSLVREAEAILADQVVALPMYSRPDIAAIWPDRVSGFTNVPGFVDTWNIEEWVFVPTGRFVDDDDSTFESDIEWLAAEGITKGCNPPVNDRFCPDDLVTRGQMAAFLVRALGYTDDGGGDLFIDDDGSTFESDIDRLGTAGVTKGCNPPLNDRFCPDDLVTRGQMAAFLVRALGYTDDGGGDLFVDDDGSTFEGDIDRLGAVGVTKGCNPPVNDRFCPSDFVTRGQMAAFLHRALE